MSSVRGKRYLIVLAYVGAGVVLTAVLPLFIVPLVLILIPRFRVWLYRLFIGQVTCPTCGTTIPLVGSWKCGSCGFVQHRHAFKGCAKCGLGVAELPCPQCDHGIFL